MVPDRKKMIREWVKQGCPEIPIAPGTDVGNLEKYLDYVESNPESAFAASLPLVRSYLGFEPTPLVVPTED